MCGRALGGHMRAHGIGDEIGNIEDEDPGSDWEDKIGTSDRNSNKRMYALRTNPNRLKSCRVCENCGKEFLSWKSFLEHGKCSSEDAESLVSSPSSVNEEDDGGQRGCGWSKRKRSFRANVGSYSSTYPSSEDEDVVLAKCLMALSNARVDPVDMEQEESCESASKDEERRNAVTAFLAPLTKPNYASFDKAKAASKGMFECKACKKVFTSHQALGGHRASHKKVKGCFAARDNQFDDSLATEDVITHEEFFSLKAPSSLQYDHSPSAPLVGASRRKSGVHECSICHRVFSTGQALGGHKRCHWLTSNTPDSTSSLKYHQHPHHFQDHNTYERPPLTQHKADPLDLNLPPTAPDIVGIRRDPHNPLSFEVSTEINLHSWANNQQHKYENEDENDHTKKTSNVVSLQNVDDEADSKGKFAKLSELNGLNVTGTSSQWLQVGIGSATDAAANP
ncbi:hypothetical protein ACET3Z_031441 [Daucus carota]